MTSLSLRIVLLMGLYSVSVSLGAAAAAAEPAYATPEAAAADPDFAIQGEYVGPERAMQVIALGDGEFEAVIYAGGLPGAAWDKSPPRRVNVDAEAVESMAQANQMRRVARQSPTLGVKPPAGALVLFDGTQKSIDAHWKGGKLVDGSLLGEGTTSVDTFDDYSLHLEFRTPFMPTARGQARGNSGVYHQGRYETQILDSFGLAGKMNETGGIYTVRDPDLNMCFPPLTWQTYDIDFNAATYDADGKKTADATLSVRLNGVVVQRDVPVPHKTRAAPMDEGAQAGPIYLQDHGNPVRFRNIWVVRRDAATEAMRPRVPGFERFGQNDLQHADSGGHLLVNELGCVACHQADQPAGLSRKQAPILSHVGNRVRPDYLLEFIRDPQHTKPGTMMPNMLAALPDDQRATVSEALVSFLMSTGQIQDRPGDRKSGQRGRNLYHTIGCTACHANQDGPRLPDATTVPLGTPASKYTLDSLRDFLLKPHSVRPSGRMPSFELSKDEATDMATYLLRDVVLGDQAANTQAAYYEGAWETLPDFDALTPYEQTQTFGFDLQASQRNERFGARFDTFFVAPKEDNYQFFLRSDDGSRLLIDGKQLLISDGVHPMSGPNGSVRLKPGPHAIRVEYFELSGQEGLSVEVQGGGIARCDLESVCVLDPDQPNNQALVGDTFQADPKQVDQGRKWFATLGCAACHELKQGESIVQSTVAARPLKQLDWQREGCLSDQVPQSAAHYVLSPLQRTAITSAIKSMQQGGSGELTGQQRVHQTMASMNCYACHGRNQIGGPEAARDGVFQTTMKEMGDEGRLPPPLDGVGDKLRPEYLTHVFDHGADERPYMKVKMPAFGTKNLAGLDTELTQLDAQTQADIQHPQQPPDKIKSAGRMLAGNKGLACVKCHTFGGKGAPGIGAIDMQRMTTRLREDWFHRYLVSPTTYRPGTRMPSSFPDGKSVVTDLYGGHPPLQIDALWQFLADGTKAREPIGVQQELIELVPNARPVIYRNFIEGLSPRGIAVGYPAHLNIAWDAGTMTLVRLWKGAFIDASKHWVGRGPGNQEPLGDEVLSLPNQVSIARLEKIDAPWPAESARQRGYQFQGYRLNPAGEPTFEYRAQGISVAEHFTPETDTTSDTTTPPEKSSQAKSSQAALNRTLTLTRSSSADESSSPETVVLCIASGQSIRPASPAASPSGQSFVIDDRFTVEVNVPAEVVEVDGKRQLRIVVPWSGDRASIHLKYRW